MDAILPCWLKSPSAQTLFDVLNVDDRCMIRVVGGAVRNYLLNVPVNDIDFATLWLPEQVIQKCETAKLKVFPTGINHGTVTVIIGQDSFEVTTLRKDVATDGRRAVVAYSRSWEEDAKRRDFTINALYMDRNGQIFDPLGGGLVDIETRSVRFIGNPQKRIQEDALRILRFFRFHAYYGRGEINADGLKACIEYRHLLSNLSKERITDELLNICSVDQYGHSYGDKFVDIIKLMIGNGVFSVLSGQEYVIDSDHLDQVVKKQKQYGLYNNLTVLFFVFNQDLNVVLQSLVLSKKQQKLLWLFEGCYKEKVTSVQKIIYQYGRKVAQQVLLSRDAGESDIELSKTWDVPVFPLTGKDLLDAGFKAGPEIGRLLKDTEKWWIERNFQPSKQDCLSFLLT